MTEITSAKIKELRASTGAGMMDCKKALMESNGDMEAATDWLRTKGLAAAAKKAGRIAAEGLVALAVDGNKAALIELNSETDFVARNEQFQQLAAKIAEYALQTGDDLEQLKSYKCQESGKTVQEVITDAIGTIGENINLRRVAVLEEPNGIIASYIHTQVAPGLGKIGVLVSLQSEADNTDGLREFGKKIAMHVAAAQPQALTREEVPADLLERERQVLVEQAMESGKPKEIAEKMVEGRIRKFYSEIVLPEQVFVIDGKATVEQATQDAEKELGGKIKITGFKRFTLGEGIEKKEEDFAEEVAKAANG